MSWLVRSSLAMLGLSLVAPIGVRAQDAPAGYQAPVGPDGKPVPTTAPAPAAAPHKHRARILCAKCAAAQNAGMMPPGKIVACAHSKNGVCTACQAALALPGPIVMVGSSVPSEAPGRALASSGMAPSSSLAARRPPGSGAAPYDGPSGEPSPIGVVQANFSPGAPMGVPAAMADPSMPGHAVAEAGAGPAPFRPKPTTSANPHIFSHLFGLSGFGAARADAKMQRKLESHAMISYDNDGTTVNELPASTVYGRR
jgi:hypothetical protein